MGEDANGESTSSTDTPKVGAVETVLLEQLKELMVKAKTMRTTIADSKTNTKKDFYRKKLRKNNERAMQLLLSLDRVAASKANRAK